MCVIANWIKLPAFVYPILGFAVFTRFRNRVSAVQGCSPLKPVKIRFDSVNLLGELKHVFSDFSVYSAIQLRLEPTLLFFHNFFVKILSRMGTPGVLNN